jgi:hypothetical protein
LVEIFARPEVELNLVQQNNVTENHLSITISAEEVREIEAEAGRLGQKSENCLKHTGRKHWGTATQSVTETRQSPKSVREKFANCRPTSGNG